MLNKMVLEIFILWSIVLSVQGCGEGLADNWDALIGSYESDAKSIPWQAGLVEIGKSAPFCGATIICHRFVMTAAHCIRPVCINNPGSCYQILIEEHDIATGLDQATRHNVKAINFHPNWFGPGVVFYDYDLALLELTEEVILTGDSRAKAACLPDPSDDYFGNGTTFIVGGWDWQSAGASAVPKYHHGSVPAMSDKECEQIYGETNTPRLHCVGHVNKGNVSCKADIGGPLTWLDPRTSKGKVIGVVSWGIGCKRPNEIAAPGAYTGIVSELDWVRQTVGSCPDQA